MVKVVPMGMQIGNNIDGAVIGENNDVPIARQLIRVLREEFGLGGRRGGEADKAEGNVN